MTSVLELEVWSPPGNTLSDDFGRALEGQFTQETGLKPGIFLALNQVPSQIDAENLAIAFQEGELNKNDFYRFCESHHFTKNVDDLNSACGFLEYSYGRKVAWLHIPSDKNIDKYLSPIAKWVRSKHLVLVDPDRLCCLI